jgi:hypothetical protein
MKKLYILLVVLLAFLVISNAQIPNAGFENWIEYGNGMKPVGWWSPNDSISSASSYFPITRSDDHYPSDNGNYSIRLENNTSLATEWAGAGIIWPGGWSGNNYPSFPVTGHPVRLRGYYKFLPQNGDSMDIHFELYKNGTPVTSGGFYTASASAEWTTFSAIVSNTDYTSVDSARIMISAFNSDNGPSGIHGNSVLYVDNLSFDNQAGFVSEHRAPAPVCIIAPNPASDFFTITLKTRINTELRLNIYDVAGNIVKSCIVLKNRQQIEIQGLSTGIYFIEIKSGHWSEKHKLAIWE